MQETTNQKLSRIIDDALEKLGKFKYYVDPDVYVDLRNLISNIYSEFISQKDKYKIFF